MNYASYSYHNYYLRLLTNLTKAICRGLGRVMGWKAILLTMSVGIQTISGDRSVLRDVHVLGGVVVSVGFLSFFQTFHLPPFLVSEFDLEEPVEVAVRVLEGWMFNVWSDPVFESPAFSGLTRPLLVIGLTVGLTLLVAEVLLLLLSQDRIEIVRLTFEVFRTESFTESFSS